MKGLDKAEELKELYERVASQYDPDGFRLYFAAQEITGIKRLWEEYPYEDACGRFTAADGHELLRYLTAAYFKAVSWEIVPGTTYERPSCEGWTPTLQNTVPSKNGSMRLSWSAWASGNGRLSCQAEHGWTMQLEKTTASEVTHDRFYDHGNQQGDLLGPDP